MNFPASHISPSKNPYRRPPNAELDEAIKQIIAEVRPYSMVPDDGLDWTIRLTHDALKADVPGELVECGTWLGGCSFAMLLTQRYLFGGITRPVRMFDSFQGMSPPSEPDGEHGRRWWGRAQSGQPDPSHQNYCKAPLEQVRDAVEKFGFGNHVMIHPGWFADTVEKHKPDAIAVLRIDCDWYDPCKLVYDTFAPLVSVGGAIVIDDYAAWEGCVLATHQYLAENNLPWRIRSVPDDNGAFMIKEKPTW